MKKKEIEVIARGVYVADGYLLIAHGRGKWYTYLPGGHVEFMEGAADALVREISEEIGTEPEVGEFLGTVEHSWVDEKGPNHEVNLVFSITLAGVSPPDPPPSRERRLEFFWKPLTELADASLEPEILMSLIPCWRERAGSSPWSSAMKE